MARLHDALFALMMLESRLLRMLEELKAEFGEEILAALGQTAPADESKNDLIQHIQDRGQGYNVYGDGGGGSQWLDAV